MSKKNEIIRELVQFNGHREFNVQETVMQMRHFGGERGLMSWGFHKAINLANRGLKFTVNGHHHKGDVLIVLDASDTYTVFILNNRARVLDKYEGVYFDQLFEVIDERIEKIKEYQS